MVSYFIYIYKALFIHITTLLFLLVLVSGDSVGCLLVKKKFKLYYVRSALFIYFSFSFTLSAEALVFSQLLFLLLPFVRVRKKKKGLKSRLYIKKFRFPRKRVVYFLLNIVCREYTHFSIQRAFPPSRIILFGNNNHITFMKLKLFWIGSLKVIESSNCFSLM